MSSIKNSLRSLKDSYFNELLKNSEIPVEQNSDMLLQSKILRTMTNKGSEGQNDISDEKPIKDFVKGFDLFSVEN